MLQKGLYGEVSRISQRAADLLPDDARILFDRACYAEIQGLPRTQVLLTPMDVAIQRTGRAGRPPNPAWTPSQAALVGIPIADVTNDEAERLFRRALRADPSFVEARVRLARLLDVRKRHDEAAAELATALAASRPAPCCSTRISSPAAPRRRWEGSTTPPRHYRRPPRCSPARSRRCWRGARRRCSDPTWLARLSPFSG